MSNNNQFWGRRFGYYDSIKNEYRFPTTGYGSRGSNSGKSITKKDSLQAKRDREAFILMIKTVGPRVKYYKSGLTRSPSVPA